MMRTVHVWLSDQDRGIQQLQRGSLVSQLLPCLLPFQQELSCFLKQMSSVLRSSEP